MKKRTKLSDINVNEELILTPPSELKAKYPIKEETRKFISDSRDTIADIVHSDDKRLLIVCGPCSVHCIEAAKEYALKLKEAHDKYKDTLYIVMRVYFEKPRTTVGWKGLINDPDLNDSFDIEKGLEKARELLLWISELGLPIATEALDPISPQYLGDLFSWSAIGARTTESQTHREMASGLSTPIGFKNGTDGSLETAINALQAASSGHSFMGINKEGQVAIIKTNGNPAGHIILRGGKVPNYDSVNVNESEEKLEKAGIEPSLMIDCSHGNSSKDHTRQPAIAQNVFNQIVEGNKSIRGIMIESYLKEGNQKLNSDHSKMEYGKSITDACIDWETTMEVFEKANEIDWKLKSR